MILWHAQWSISSAETRVMHRIPAQQMARIWNSSNRMHRHLAMMSIHQELPDDGPPAAWLSGTGAVRHWRAWVRLTVRAAQTAFGEKPGRNSTVAPTACAQYSALMMPCTWCSGRQCRMRSSGCHSQDVTRACTWAARLLCVCRAPADPGLLRPDLAHWRCVTPQRIAQQKPHVQYRDAAVLTTSQKQMHT